MSEAKNIHHQIMSLIGKLDNGSHSSSQLQAVDMEIYKLFCNYLAEKDKEIERLQKRDGNAKIELCYDDGNNPFARSECMVVDFGVCDNQYVIESELLNKTLSEAKGWRDMCSRMDLQLRDLLMSADCEWENKRQGHDWAEACESTRKLLAAYNAMKDEQPEYKEAGK